MTDSEFLAMAQDLKAAQDRDRLLTLLESVRNNGLS